MDQPNHLAPVPPLYTPAVGGAVSLTLGYVKATQTETEKFFNILLVLQMCGIQLVKVSKSSQEAA